MAVSFGEMAAPLDLLSKLMIKATNFENYHLGLLVENNKTLKIDEIFENLRLATLNVRENGIRKDDIADANEWFRLNHL